MKTYSIVINFLATGFYSGKTPVSPGTSGTFIAAVIVFFAYPLRVLLADNYSGALFLVFFTLFSVGVVNEALRLEIYGKNADDPQQIVLDEFAGFFVAMLGLPLSFQSVAVAFILFRFFDITKIFPANKLENLPRGWGIVLDDIMAGAYANIMARVIFAYWVI